MQTLFSADNKNIGTLSGGVWTKKVRASVHFLRQPAAIAFDAAQVDRLMADYSITGFRVIDTETGDTYSLHRETWDERSRSLDRGHGKQYYVAIMHWTKTPKGAPLPEITTKTGQASLF